MTKYLKCELVDVGEPITFRDFCKKYNEKMDELVDPNTIGYEFVDDCGYIEFYGQFQFDRNMIRLDDNKNLPSRVSIGKEMVDKFIKSYEVIERDGKTTIVHATLINGYKLVESSSCVDPANYSREIGVEICLNKIKDQLWQLLGFLLQTAVGLNKEE